MILVKVIWLCVFNRPNIGLFIAFPNFQAFSFKKFAPWLTIEPPRHKGQITDHNSLSFGIDKVKIGHCTISTNQPTNYTAKIAS